MSYQTTAVMVKKLLAEAKAHEKEATRCRHLANGLRGMKFFHVDETKKRPASPPPFSRVRKLRNFLKSNGPSTVCVIRNKTGVNFATIYSSLKRHEDKFFTRDARTNKWAIIPNRTAPLSSKKADSAASSDPVRHIKKNRDMRVYDFLRENGPNKASTIIQKTGLPLGTVMSVLNRNTKGLFARTSGLWHLTTQSLSRKDTQET